jgi:hypothetical protein
LTTKKEALKELLEKLEHGSPLLIVGLNDERIPNIHNFYPKKYYESIQHCGWGFFEGCTEHGKFSFDGGGAMHHVELEDGWLSWSPLRVENGEVLKDLDYDCQKVANVLREIINSP